MVLLGLPLSGDLREVAETRRLCGPRVRDERELRPGRRLLIQQPLHFLGRYRATEQITLAEATAHLPQPLGLGGMLDSLGHGRETERVAEPQNRVDERLVQILADELVDERLRDLQGFDRELRETAQRG